MSIYHELDHLNLEELMDRFEGPPVDGIEYATTYYTEVTLLLIQQGEPGYAYLWQQLDSAETDRLRAILFALTQPDAHKSMSRKTYKELLDRLFFYLDDDRELIVAEAVDGLTSQKQRGALTNILALSTHSSPYVRGSVLRFLARLFPDKALPYLIEGLKDSHFIVRENAADEMGELGELEALPHLYPVLTDEHPDVRQAVQTAIEMIKGDYP